MDNNNKRVALVTGATGGLGTDMCKRLHNDGYRVVGNYRNPEKAKKWKEEMKSDGYDFDIFQGDVCDFDSTEKWLLKSRKMLE